jgi:hypothetical protein
MSVTPVHIDSPQTESDKGSRKSLNSYFKSVSFVHQSDGYVFFCHSEMSTAFKFIYYCEFKRIYCRL